MTPRTILLIDLDNCNDHVTFQTILQFCAPDIHHVFFGLDNVYRQNGSVSSANSPHHKKRLVIDSWFREYPEQLECYWVQHGIKNAADMMMLNYIGEHMSSWIDDGVENVIISSSDMLLAHSLLLLKYSFKVWHMQPESKVRHNTMLADSRKLGMTVPLIKIKNA